MQVGWLVVVLHGDWFYLDDFLRFGESARAPLGWAYLTAGVDNHLAIGWRLVVACLQRSVGLDFTAAATVIAVTLVATLLGLLRILEVVLGRRPLAAGIGALWAISPLGLFGTSWFSNGLHTLPTVAAEVWCVGEALRWRSTGSRRHLVAALVAEVVALGFYEKGLLVVLLLPLALATVVPAGEEGGGLRGAWQRVAGPGRWWLLFAPAPAAYVIGYLHGGYLALAPGKPADAAQLASGVGRLFAETIAPGLVGGPLRWRSLPPIELPVTAAPGWLVVVGLAAAVAAVVAALRRGGSGVRGLAFAAVAVAASEAVAVYGRIVIYPGLARDDRYGGDVAIWVAVGAAIAVGCRAERVVGPARRPAHLAAHRAAPRPRPIGRRAAGGVLVAAYLVTSAVSTVDFTDGWYPTVAVTRTYWSGLSATASGPVQLLDGAVPDEIADPLRWPVDLVSWNLRTLHVPATAGEGPGAVTADHRGRLVPGRLLVTAATGAAGLVGGTPDGPSRCTVGGAAPIEAPTGSEGATPGELVELTTTVAQPATVLVEEHYGPAWREGVTVALPAGTATTVAALGALPNSGLRLSTSSPTPVCVVRVAVGRGVPTGAASPAPAG